MPAKRSAFGESLQEHIETVIEVLREEGLEASRGGTPDLEKIRPQLGPQEEPLPGRLQFILSAAHSVGSALEWKGEPELALSWYRLGAISWRGERQFAHNMADDPPSTGARRAAGRNQLKTAVCADRVGMTDRANQLYDWVTFNRSLTPDEIQFYEENDLQTLWEFFPYKTYALICQEKWKEGFALAKQTDTYIKQDRRAQGKESYQTHIKINHVVLALSSYMVESTPSNRKAAIAALDLQSVASRSHADHRNSLFYLYNLRARHPDLAHPDPEELPPGERCRQGYQACIKWLARVGLELDGTPESLHLLDQKAPEVYPYIDNEVDEKTFIFLFGSYLGEVIRRELAGGQWIFEGNHMLDWKLDWEMGEAGFHILPFRQVARRGKGTEGFSLHDVWQEAEKTYMNLGLAAKYKD